MAHAAEFVSGILGGQHSRKVGLQGADRVVRAVRVVADWGPRRRAPAPQRCNLCPPGSRLNGASQMTTPLEGRIGSHRVCQSGPQTINSNTRMKRLLIIALGLCLLGVAAPNSSPAAKGNKPKREKRQQDIFGKYDVNKNSVLDADEIAALKKDFDAGTSADLKKLDLNSNGKLDDNEVAAIKPEAKKKRKKNQ